MYIYIYADCVYKVLIYVYTHISFIGQHPYGVLNPKSILFITCKAKDFTIFRSSKGLKRREKLLMTNQPLNVFKKNTWGWPNSHSHTKVSSKNYKSNSETPKSSMWLLPMDDPYSCSLFQHCFDTIGQPKLIHLVMSQGPITGPPGWGPDVSSTFRFYIDDLWIRPGAGRVSVKAYCWPTGLAFACLT